MNRLWLLLSISLAYAQQQPAPVGDIFSVNTQGQTAETPLRAFANLYQIAAEMTQDPSSEYDPGHGPKSDFPYPADIEKQWVRSVATNGKQLTAEERRQLIPCAAHLRNAIGSMERGYRIKISQVGNAPAQKSAQNLYAMGRAEFALCSGVDEFANNELKKLPPGTGDQSRKRNDPTRPPLKGGVSKGPGTGPGPGPGTGDPSVPPRSDTPNTPPGGKEPVPVQYTKGIFQGLTDCAQYGVNALSSAFYMATGDFVTAAQLLGLEPGQSLILRSIYQEATTNNFGISPFEAGRIAGRRICSYVIVPTAAKIPKGIKGLRTLGRTPFNPLEGSAVLENSAGLADTWIRTPKGPVRLGGFIGSGELGSVYKLADQPGKVIKVSNTNPDSPASFPRQLNGYNHITQETRILTPKIYDYMPGGEQQPSFLVMDNVNTKWPGAQFFSNVKDIVNNPPRKAAVQQLYDELKNNGLVWVDGHQLNVAFANVAGKLRAIVVDADMIFKGSELGNQDISVRVRLNGALQGAGGRGIMSTSVEAKGPLWTRYSNTGTSSWPSRARPFQRGCATFGAQRVSRIERAHPLHPISVHMILKRTGPLRIGYQRQRRLGLL